MYPPQVTPQTRAAAERFYTRPAYIDIPTGYDLDQLVEVDHDGNAFVQAAHPERKQP